MGQISRIRDFDDLHYDPFTAMGKLGGEDRISDLDPEISRLRTISPVFKGDLRECFGLHRDLTVQSLRHVAPLGHNEVIWVLRDPANFFNGVYTTKSGCPSLARSPQWD